jgi:inorganic pyrophosphatase
LEPYDSHDLWRALDALVDGSALKIDRPKGSAHPRYPNFHYPLDYGYLEGTTSADGAGIDVWIGSLPEKQVTALLCTVDLEKRDTEIKLLLGCTPQEARHLLAIHNRGTQSAMLLERPKRDVPPAQEAD